MDFAAAAEFLKAFAKTEAFSTLVAGAAGAFAGAVGAQFFIARGQAKQSAIAELNALNSAATLCSFICGTYLNLKKQHVNAIAGNYLTEQRRHEAFLRRRASYKGDQPLVFKLVVDLNTIAPITVPIRTLEHQVFEEASVGARALSLASQLTSSVAGLNQAIQTRTELALEQRQAALEGEMLAAWYFGLQFNGVADRRLAQSVAALSSQTDDCIFFSYELGQELTSHAVKLRSRHVRRLRFGLPKSIEADWSAAQQAGLFPDRANYSSWIDGFKKRPNKITRLIDHLLRRKKRN